MQTWVGGTAHKGTFQIFRYTAIAAHLKEDLKLPSILNFTNNSEGGNHLNLALVSTRRESSYLPKILILEDREEAKTITNFSEIGESSNKSCSSPSK